MTNPNLERIRKGEESQKKILFQEKALELYRNVVENFKGSRLLKNQEGSVVTTTMGVGGLVFTIAAAGVMALGGGEKVSENEPNSVAMTSSVQLEEDANNDNQISKQVNELERDFKKWKKMSGSEKQNIAHDLWVRAGDLYTETTDPVLEVKLEEIYNVTQEY